MLGARLEAGSELAIKASSLGKRYRIGAKADDKLSSRLLSFVRGSGATRELWALRGVDLEVRRGECLGVIGPNGAGKTTLLMLLAGLLEPTEGSVAAMGEVSPFFQIGSGLYSELTVLDNIRLAAALFGMTSAQLKERLDAIVAFGELEEYLYARLGELSVGFQSRVPFSTALHADVDILLTDEVFAVGDASFTGKCLTRMGAWMLKGKTMIIASHSMELIEAYCSRAVYVDHGKVQAQGEPAAVVAQYLSRVRPAE